MKVCVVTGYTPTEENTRGISGLLYSLLRYRPSNISLTIITFNYNKIEDVSISHLEKDLNAEIIQVHRPWWAKIFGSVWMWRVNKFFMKKPLECYMVTKKVVNIVKSTEADLVFVYPYFFYRLAYAMPETKFVVSGCDCEALIRIRNFEIRSCLMSHKELRHNYLMLQKGLNFEKEWNRPNIKVHFVGMEDYRFYKQIYGYANSHFLLHPHYALAEKQINFNKPVLSVIIAGSYDIYMRDDVDRMLPNILKYKHELRESFKFTFLGKKWERISQQFLKNGLSCECKTWVDDYAQELISHDIQLSPISYGTGTKGKVLSALSNGLLVVGSNLAFENICVRHNDSCYRYTKAEEVATTLLFIARKRILFEKIAEKGRRQVRTYHAPCRISKRFFDIYSKSDN